jgi:hypothetical protein
VSIKPITVAVRSRAWVYGRSVARIEGSNAGPLSVLCVVR